MKGKIVYYNKEKGYGFIESPQHEKNIFFHVKNLYKTPIENVDVGCEVEFNDLENSDKGMITRKLQIITN